MSRIAFLEVVGGYVPVDIYNYGARSLGASILMHWGQVTLQVALQAVWRLFLVMI